MKKILASVLVVVATVIGGFGLMMPVAAEIGDICEDGNGIPENLKEAAGCTLEDDDTAMPVVVGLIDVALSLVGLIAVGMIVYGAITYVISTGDAVKLNRAKNAILYGVIGLVVALLAYAIVTFVSQSIWGESL